MTSYPRPTIYHWEEEKAQSCRTTNERKRIKELHRVSRIYYYLMGRRRYRGRSPLTTAAVNVSRKWEQVDCGGGICRQVVSGAMTECGVILIAQPASHLIQMASGETKDLHEKKNRREEKPVIWKVLQTLSFLHQSRSSSLTQFVFVLMRARWGAEEEVHRRMVEARN